MSGVKDQVALDWIKSDLLETIESARVSLDQFAETGEEMQLRTCLTSLHQVHGTLVMLDLEGVTLLADHLEQLCQSLFDQSLSDTEQEAAAALLMQGILELPAHLQEIQRVGEEQTQAVVPLANDVRTLLGMAPLAGSGANLATKAPAQALDRFAQIDGAEKIQRIRSALQNVLLRVLKGEDRAQVLPVLEKVAVGLQRVTVGLPMERQWQAFAEWLTALAKTSGALDADAVQLLRRVDAALKNLLADTATAIRQPADVALVQDLVNASLAAAHASEVVIELQQAVESNNSTGDSSLAMFGRQALSSAAVALKDELASIKDKLDLLVRAPQIDLEVLRSLIDPLRQIGSTLSMLGFESSREIVADQVDAVENLVVLGDTDPQNIQSIAGALVQIDENLSSVVQGSEKTEVEQITSEAEIRLLQEARTGIEQVKQGVVDFVSAQWDVRHLDGLDRVLVEVIGALDIIPLPRAVALLGQANSYIQDKLLHGHQPSWQELDLFADGVSGIDYYLERLAQDGGSGIEEVLGAAQRGFVELGELLLAEQAAQSPTVDTDALARQPGEQDSQATPELSAASIPQAPVEPDNQPEPFEPGGSLDAETIESDTHGPEAVELEAAQPETDLIEEDAQDAVEAVHTPIETSDAEAIEAEAPTAASAAPEDAALVQPDQPELASGAVNAEAHVDAEIAEIFVEECAEVFASIDVWLPQWLQALPAEADQTESVTELRRAFHTLKGSGRIVQAAAIGELAWAIENMLNRVIDGTVVANAQFGQAISAARSMLPELVDAFAQGHDGDMDALGLLIDQADVLASGGSVEELAEPTPSAQTDQPAQDDVAIDVFAADHAAEDRTDDLPDSSSDDATNDTTTAQQAAEAVESNHDESIEALEFELDDSLTPAMDTQDAAADQADVTPTEVVADIEASFTEPSSLEPDELVVDETDDWLTESVSTPTGAKSSALDLFLNEAFEQLQIVQTECARVPWSITEPMMRAFHTLAGSTAIAGVEQTTLLIEPTYQVLEACAQQEVTSELEQFVKDATDLLLACFTALRDEAEWDEPLEFVARADDLIAQTQADTKPSITEQLLASAAIGEVMDGEEALLAYSSGEHASCADLLAAMSEAERVLKDIDQPASAELAQSLVAALTATTVAGQVAPTVADPLKAAYRALVNQLNAIVVGTVPADAQALISDLDRACDEAAVEPTDEEMVADLIESAETDVAQANAVEFEAEPTPAAETVAGVPPSTEHTDAPVAVEDHFEASDQEIDQAQVEEEDAQPLVQAQPDSASAQYDADESVDAVQNAVAETTLAAASSDHTFADIDPDLVEIFFDEAEELSEELENAIVSWAEAPENRLHMETLLRALHTFKGGARLCGLSELGDVAHNFESFLIEVQSEQRPVDQQLFTLLNQRYDALTQGLQQAAQLLAGDTNEDPAAPDLSDNEAAATIRADAQLDKPPVDVAHVDKPVGSDQAIEPDTNQPMVTPSSDREAPVEAAAPGSETTAVNEAEQTAPAVQPTLTSSDAPAPAERSSQEMVRVGSGLLEELVNLAGEGSILRARIEQGMADFTGALDEMETTIERLREQLRRMEIETEAQILYRHKQDGQDGGPDYEDFDPLEMDRYSQLQQLSKGLAESASDMLDLKDTLLFKARESETLLLQQARVNTELQEGLMRTRMVPFNRMLPRLRRIVRQVSTELGKEVELHVQNAEGELDRNLLERMVPPLEHMLRNAIDHGIELPQVREGFGKAPSGRIDLRLSREGGDVVIEISDDGAGVDVETVRAKALDNELIAADANLTDEEVIQFILAPGFSTAKSVTQISGRGVGMDVVHSEVKQLGGSINIQSSPGRGSRFIVRVPFTVSVNRALMVSVAEDQYAIPLNNIEGIVLLSPEQLDELYSSENKTFEYAGVPYRVRYLGQYLGREYQQGAIAGPAQEPSSVPMVLVRSGDHAVAIHVDSVHGSREIVVKSLGPQFAGVGGISGATILGDGSVVVILDLLALIRAAQFRRPRAVESGIKKSGPCCVLVVDDSVTVRKVTSRLLERQGMDVLLAKDGIEAVAMLQERRPDVMLLDIEMPRMDGFEVARQVRHDERLQQLPIVMISSRTGDKHKEHAEQLGVNHFLGKPFQEHELLATIDQLVPGGSL